MTRHHVQEFVPYDPKAMFDLVLDVATYPEFIPWCRAARILSQTEQGFMAELMIAFKHIRESYVSHVIPDENALSIHVEMVRGPFHHLTNDWKFEAKDGGCHIDFVIDFAFKGKLLETLIGALFNRASRKMVTAFKDRADVLYGS